MEIQCKIVDNRPRNGPGRAGGLKRYLSHLGPDWPTGPTGPARPISRPGAQHENIISCLFSLMINGSRKNKYS